MESCSTTDTEFIARTGHFDGESKSIGRGSNEANTPAVEKGNGIRAVMRIPGRLARPPAIRERGFSRLEHGGLPAIAQTGQPKRIIYWGSGQKFCKRRPLAL
jgi:hypothetical protein